MSTYMVQENHQEKFKFRLFQYAIPLYFLWVILDHPVYLPLVAFAINFDCMDNITEIKNHTFFRHPV